MILFNNNTNIYYIVSKAPSGTGNQNRYQKNKNEITKLNNLKYNERPRKTCCHFDYLGF
jgi:hypothetical protein